MIPDLSRLFLELSTNIFMPFQQFVKNLPQTHRKLHNLSPDDFERSFGLHGIQKPVTKI